MRNRIHYQWLIGKSRFCRTFRLSISRGCDEWRGKFSFLVVFKIEYRGFVLGRSDRIQSFRTSQPWDKQTRQILRMNKRWGSQSMIADLPYSSNTVPVPLCTRITPVAHRSAEKISESHRRPQNPVESNARARFTQDEAEKPPEDEAKQGQKQILLSVSLC
jgi:hypothetical protein